MKVYHLGYRPMKLPVDMDQLYYYLVFISGKFLLHLYLWEQYIYDLLSSTAINKLLYLISLLDCFWTYLPNGYPMNSITRLYG